jgi:hypothetical protein
MQRIIFLFILFIWTETVTGQVSLFDELHPDSVTHIRLEADFRKIIREKMKPVYQKGNVRFLSGPLKDREYTIQLKGRGNIRKEVCFFPPLKLKFPKSEFNFHKLKWVNVCRSSKDMDAALFKEYLSYKIYQTLTEKSFDVRLFHLEAYDDRKEDPYLSCYAFIIEPMKRLIQRTATKEYAPKVMRARVLDKYYYALTNVFEYLIANTDWNIDNSHNLKFLRTGDVPGVIPVPYDFDYSGFVNASYAVPHESMPIENVQERHNKGHCFSEEEMEVVYAHVLSKKAEILEIINTFELMDERSRKRLLNFLNKGFDELENEKVRIKIFSKNCEPFKS